jgi:hypothetical protein
MCRGGPLERAGDVSDGVDAGGLHDIPGRAFPVTPARD